MKKYLPFANYLAAGAGIVASLLYKWALSVGPDSKGLYPAAHPGWIGYLLIIVAVTAAIFCLTRSCGAHPGWAGNFAGGPLPILGHAAAACGILIYSLPLLQNDRIGLFCGVLGLCSAGALGAMAIALLRKKNPPTLLFLLPCLFFALLLVLFGKQYGSETQLVRYLPQFLAFSASSLACYELAGFGAEAGNRKKSLFWSLTATALCFAAASSQWFFAALGLWHLLSHCLLAEPSPEVTVEETIEETVEEIVEETAEE